MKILLRIVGGVLLLFVVSLAALFVGARFSDGPLEIMAGGPFTSGELVTGAEPDWAFVHDIQEVEFQLLAPPRSRTTWIIEHQGKAYIPSGYMTTWWGRIWKRWPAEAELDGRILLRVGDKLYERQLRRIQAGPEIQPIVTELSRKYGRGAEIGTDLVDSGYLWLFELAPRP